MHWKNIQNDQSFLKDIAEEIGFILMDFVFMPPGHVTDFYYKMKNNQKDISQEY